GVAAASPRGRGPPLLCGGPSRPCPRAAGRRRAGGPGGRKLGPRAPALTASMPEHRNPIPTTDAIIEGGDGRIVLVLRKNIPHGWAIPGGFVDYGEEVGRACVREAKEETGLDVDLVEQLFTYSDPKR